MAQIPEYLDEIIRKADILVFEGFEMTGKSTLARQIQNKYHPSFLYRPNWEEVLTTDVVHRGNRHIPGISIVDMWGDMILDGIVDQKTKLLIDRWMAVSVVYQIMYQQQSDASSAAAIAKACVAAARDFNLVFIHKNHSSKEEARKMYEITMGEAVSDHSDIYDKFQGFDDYYQKYVEFEKAYDEFYSSPMNPFRVVKVSSYTNEMSNRGY